MGLVLLVLGLILFLGVHILTTHTATSAPRSFSRPARDLQDPLFAGFSRRHCPDRGDLVAIMPVARIRSRSPPPAMRQRHRSPDAAGRHLVVASYLRGKIYMTLKHPMLAGVKTVGFRAPACEWRPGRHHPVRLVPRLGGLSTAFR